MQTFLIGRHSVAGSEVDAGHQGQLKTLLQVVSELILRPAGKVLKDKRTRAVFDLVDYLVLFSLFEGDGAEEGSADELMLAGLGVVVDAELEFLVAVVGSQSPL